MTKTAVGAPEPWPGDGAQQMINAVNHLMAHSREISNGDPILQAVNDRIVEEFVRDELGRGS